MTHAIEVEQCPRHLLLLPLPTSLTGILTTVSPLMMTANYAARTYQQAVQILSHTSLWTRRSSGDYGRMSTISHSHRRLWSISCQLHALANIQAPRSQTNHLSTTSVLSTSIIFSSFYVKTTFRVFAFIDH